MTDHRTAQAEGWRKVAVGDAKAWKARAEKAEAENERLRENAREAAAALCMTQCPAYNDGGVCASGCYTEPACQTDEPTEGWIVAALNLLVPDEDEESPLPSDEKATSDV